MRRIGSTLGEWLRRVRGIVRPNASDADFDEELRLHVALAEEELRRQGRPPNQILRETRLKTGGLGQAMDALRDQRGLPWVADAVRDSRYAIRTLRRTPSFTIISIVTLALGIGSAVAVFSVVDGVLLRPLAYPEPQQLHGVRTMVPALDARGGPVNGRHFHEWRTRCLACADTALIAGNGFTLTGRGEPERVPGLEVSFNFFRTLRVMPALGTDFTEQDERPGGHKVALLADALWRRRFLADPAVIGQQVVINGELVEIVGVMPAALRLLQGSQWGPYFAHNLDPEIFVPFRLPFATMSGLGNLNYSAVVRLTPGVTAARAEAEMLALLAEFTRRIPVGVELRIGLVPLHEQVTGGASAALWLLMAAVGVVLIIVCVNVGTLMLVRAMNRTREIAIRLAIGGSRSSVFRLVLTEVAVLVVVAGVVGVMLAQTPVAAFTAAAVEVPRADEVSMSWRVFGFAALIATAAGGLCTLFPAWQLSRTSLQQSFKNAGSTSANRRFVRLGDALVAFEAAASALLLVVGGLLVVSFIQVLRIDAGFGHRQVVTIAAPIGPQLDRYRTVDARNDFIDRALDSLGQIAGVEAVGVTTALPLQGEMWVDDVVDADVLPVPEPGFVGNYRFVSPGYFAAMSINLKEGRYLEARDRNRSVAVVSESVARRLWPGASAIGKRLRRGTAQTPALVEVVGVVADVRVELEKEAPMTVYEPYWVIGPGGPSFVMRTPLEPAALLRQVRGVMSTLDPELPLHPPRTIEQIIDESVHSRRLQTALVAMFALSALLVAAIGTYGVISSSVARRTKELGLRMSLGARPRHIFLMVLRRGLAPPLVGFVLGGATAVAVGRLIVGQLYGVSSEDPLTLVVAASVLVATSAIACWLPARRATKVDPAIALRTE